MAREVKGASRSDVFSADPDSLTLVWPTQCEEMGPRDLALDEHPELHPYFAHDITAPLNESHIESMLAPLPPPSKGRVGVIQPLAVAMLEQNEEGIFEAMISRPGSWNVVCDGRTRTREAREANRRIREAGGGEADIIRVRFEIKPVSGAGAILIRDIAQRCRKTERPLDLARRAEFHITQATPKEIVLQAMGLSSWQQVEHYALLVTLDPKLQELVNTYKVPIREAVSIGRTCSPAEQAKLATKLENRIKAKKVLAGKADTSPVKLTGREVTAVRSEQGTSTPAPMTQRQIRKWIEKLERERDPAARIALAVLKTVKGQGSMEGHPAALAPPENPRAAKQA